MTGPDPRPSRVEPKPLAALTQFGGIAPTPDSAVALTGAAVASTAIRPGDLFAALPGSSTHGARFVADAASRGAVAILTDAAGAAIAADCGLPIVIADDPRARLGEISAWIYDYPARAMTMIGVTGTEGKTTTTFLIDAAARAAGQHVGVVGTTGTYLDGRHLPGERTTPEAPELQALLARMREEGITLVAAEVSSHALALHRVDGIRFDVGAITNLTRDHLDFHHTVEEYYRTKLQLFTPARAAIGVVNEDGANTDFILREATIALRTVSARHPATLEASGVRRTAGGSQFTLIAGERHLPVTLGAPGAFNVENALLALGCLDAAGIDLAAAIPGLATTSGAPGRMERIDAGAFTVVVDYAHTPEALRKVLADLRSVTTGRLIAVGGAGGDRDAGKRPEIGAALAAADRAIITSDNPRSEPPEAIIDAVAAGFDGPASSLETITDRRAAMTRALQLAGPGDVVVVFGRGHEPLQELAGHTIPFDDRQVVRELIGAGA